MALSAVYGYESRPRNDPMVSIVDNFRRVAAPGLAPEKVSLTKTLSFVSICSCFKKTNALKLSRKVLHTPDRFPGSWIKREMREAHTWRTEMVEMPFRYALERTVRFSALTSKDA